MGQRGYGEFGSEQTIMSFGCSSKVVESDLACEEYCPRLFFEIRVYYPAESDLAIVQRRFGDGCVAIQRVQYCGCYLATRALLRIT